MSGAIALAALPKVIGWAVKPSSMLAIGGAVLTLSVAVQTARLGHAKHDLAAVRVELTAANDGLRQCQANRTELTAEIDRQNAAVSAAQADGARRTAAAQKAAQDAESRAGAYQKRAAVLLSKPPAGDDVCARVQDADRRVLEGLE